MGADNEGQGQILSQPRYSCPPRPSILSLKVLLIFHVRRDLDPLFTLIKSGLALIGIYGHTKYENDI